MLLLASCGHDAPRPEREIPAETGGDDGERPGVGGGADLDSELNDDVWRVGAGGVWLRYDRGGVLFVSTGTGVEITDLDGADSVSVTLPAVGPDSVSRGAEVYVNGRRLDLLYVKMLKRGQRSVWYELMPADGAARAMVLPAR